MESNLIYWIFGAISGAGLMNMIHQIIKPKQKLKELDLKKSSRDKFVEFANSFKQLNEKGEEISNVLYEKEDNKDLDAVLSTLDEIEIKEVETNNESHSTFHYENGIRMKLWTLNLWYGFGSHGALYKGSEKIYEWKSKFMGYDRLLKFGKLYVSNIEINSTEFKRIEKQVEVLKVMDIILESKGDKSLSVY